ncbi:MAG TPA: hypothetical protein VFG10_13885 [Saprospiraceae bacterium]|nr:hypothetical protein [Saprospiraceae bacterium]
MSICLSLFAQNEKENKNKNFKSQIFNIQNSINLHYKGDTLFAIRDRQKIASGLTEMSVFLETEVSVQRLNGSIQISAHHTNTWFVPMTLGTKPIKLSKGKCIRVLCERKSNYIYDCPPCEVKDFYDRISILSSIDAMCQRAYFMNIMYTACDSIYPYDYFNSGVIIKANEIKINDPEGFKPNPNATIMFKEDNDGNLIRLPDKEKKD